MEIGRETMRLEERCAMVGKLSFIDCASNPCYEIDVASINGYGKTDFATLINQNRRAFGF